jgi:hypothetical protein
MPRSPKKTVLKTPAKPGKTGTAMAVSQGVQDKLRVRLQQDVERGVHGENNNISISTRGFTFKGNDLGSELAIVVVDQAYLNEWYDRPYDPENPSTPACFSLSYKGPVVDEMIPHPDSPLPQADTCKNCGHNQFGSANTGKGKSCRNRIRLALIPADNLPGVATAEMAFHSCGVNSALSFETYRKSIQRLDKVPVCGVVTRLFINTDFEQPVAGFEKLGNIDDEKIIDSIMDRTAEANGPLMQPYDKSNWTASEETPKKSGRTSSRGSPPKGRTGKASKFSK